MNAVWNRALALSLLTVGAVGGMSGAAWATPSPPTPIAIVNPSFEADTVPNGSSGTQNYWYTGSFTGWAFSGTYGGWYHPAQPAYPGGGNNNSPASGIPDGVQVAWLNNNGSGDNKLSQVLSATLQSNATYAFSFYVGRRADFVLPTNYSVELLAGSNVLATLVNPVVATAGTFQQYTLSYTTPFFDPLSGQSLGLALLASGSAGGQVNFDNLSLTVVTNANTYIPEPAVLWLMASGISALAALQMAKHRGASSRG